MESILTDLDARCRELNVQLLLRDTSEVDLRLSKLESFLGNPTAKSMKGSGSIGSLKGIGSMSSLHSNIATSHSTCSLHSPNRMVKTVKVMIPFETPSCDLVVCSSSAQKDDAAAVQRRQSDIMERGHNSMKPHKSANLHESKFSIFHLVYVHIKSQIELERRKIETKVGAGEIIESKTSGLQVPQRKQERNVAFWSFGGV
jgi:hypothetical protein